MTGSSMPSAQKAEASFAMAQRAEANQRLNEASLHYRNAIFYFRQASEALTKIPKRPSGKIYFPGGKRN